MVCEALSFLQTGGPQCDRELERRQQFHLLRQERRLRDQSSGRTRAASVVASFAANLPGVHVIS